MTDRPILFSGPMVRALLAGRKTQTRRMLKLPTRTHSGGPIYERADLGGWAATTVGGPGCFYLVAGQRVEAPERPAIWHQTTGTTMTPPYKAGDRLWVKETWSAIFWSPEDIDGDTIQFWDQPKAQRTKDVCSGVFYRQDEETKPHPFRFIPEVSWAPSLFMHRWASRLTLTVTDVRVQRVQEISEADALAEGIVEYEPTMEDTAEFAPWAGAEIHDNARSAYARLWNSLHDKPGERWADNPWVVALTFTVEQRNIDARATEETTDD